MGNCTQDEIGLEWSKVARPCFAFGHTKQMPLRPAPRSQLDSTRLADSALSVNFRSLLQLRPRAGQVEAGVVLLRSGCGQGVPELFAQLLSAWGVARHNAEGRLSQARVKRERVNCRVQGDTSIVRPHVACYAHLLDVD